MFITIFGHDMGKIRFQVPDSYTMKIQTLFRKFCNQLKICFTTMYDMTMFEKTCNLVPGDGPNGVRFSSLSQTPRNKNGYNLDTDS